MSQSLEPPASNELDAFEQQFPSIGRWIRLLTGLFKYKTWREIGDTAGKNPTFEGNWANYTATATFNTAAFYKDAFGVVHIKGLVENTTGTGINTTIFTLPTGYIPSKNYIFTTIGDGAIARIDIDSDGTVDLSTVGTGATYLSLDGITFRAEQ